MEHALIVTYRIFEWFSFESWKFTGVYLYKILRRILSSQITTSSLVLELFSCKRMLRWKWGQTQQGHQMNMLKKERFECQVKLWYKVITSLNIFHSDIKHQCYLYVIQWLRHIIIMLAMHYTCIEMIWKNWYYATWETQRKSKYLKTAISVKWNKYLIPWYHKITKKPLSFLFVDNIYDTI